MWCIIKQDGGLWRTCTFGSDAWMSASWRWKVSENRAVAERKALDLNRQERARLANCGDRGTMADVQPSPENPVERSRSPFYITGSSGMIEESTMLRESEAKPRRAFQSMQLDARTHNAITKAAERLAERKGCDVSRVDVVRWAVRSYLLEQGFADLLAGEGGR